MLCVSGFELYSRWMPLVKQATIPACWSSIKDTELLNHLHKNEVYTESLREFQIDRPDYYFKRGYESYDQAEDYRDTNT